MSFPSKSVLLLAGLFLPLPLAAQAAGAETALRADFQNPPAAFQTRPLWFWNGPPQKQKTTEIMERSRASGYSGFGILPVARQMQLKFMSPEFLDQYAHAVDEAARLGLKMCLYDEDWFPSGAAGGLLAERHPEALSRRLDLDAQDVEGPASVERRLPPGDLMAAVAMHAKTFQRINLADHVRDGVLRWNAPAGPWKVMLFTCVPDGARGLVNYLDPEAVTKFIGLTYEKYYQRFPARFGSTIDSAFYDEPTMHWLKGGRAWTPQFNRWFNARHGFDPALLYPALWFDIGPETAAARNALFGFRADLYADGFVKTVADWCRLHRVALTGHQDQEEVVNPVGLCGDLMKSMRDQDIPGVDQVFQYGRGSPAYKIISSIACNYDRPLVMTECYGAMKAMPLPNLYREAMDQFAKGINLMVPHAVWYDSTKVMFEPELSWRTPPYAAELPAYNRYMARLQRMLQGGRHVADVAVLYPIATLQAGYHFDGPLKPYVGGIIPPEADYMDVGQRLALDVRRDFTFLHPEVLDAKCTVDGPTLRLANRVNHQLYRIVVIPGSRAIHASNLAKIRGFYNQGGVVLATTRLPDCSAEPGKDAAVREMIAAVFGAASTAADSSGITGLFRVHTNARGGRAYFLPQPTAAAIQAALDDAKIIPDVRWEQPIPVSGGNLSYIHKVLDGHELWFFGNSSDTSVDVWIQLRSPHTLERWDPHTGRIAAQPSQPVRDGEATRVRLSLAAVQSVFFVAPSAATP